MSEQSNPVQVTAEDVLRGLIAALAVRERRTLVASQAEVHRAFYRVLQELEELNQSGQIRVDLLDVDFDPLYGLSGWLDRALTSAQRDLLISFPNPSYDRIEIRYHPAEAGKVLDRIGNADVLRRLAATFDQELAAQAA